jgi:hypothetical protein
MRDRPTAGQSQSETVAAIAEMEGRLRGHRADLASMAPPPGRSGVAPRRAPRDPAADPLAEIAAKVAAAHAASEVARKADAPGRPVSVAAGTPASVPRRPPRRPPAPPDDALAAARRAIAAAEEEVRGVLASAREQLAAIGVRTREALERMPAPVAAAAPTSAPAAGGWDQDHVYAGTLSIACGPFAGVEQLSAFERALESVDGVDEVYTHSFDGNDVHFEVSLARPTVLLVQLRRAFEGRLTLVDGGDRHVRLGLAGPAET